MNENSIFKHKGIFKNLNGTINHNTFFSFFVLFLLLTLLQMLPFPALHSYTAHLHPTPNLLPSGHHHTVVCVYGLCIYALQVIPSPCFIQFPLSPLPPLWHLSVCSMYPCVCFYFFYQIPHISEIICYLSLSNCLISLSIIIFRSIYVIAKSKVSFFFLPSCRIPSC